MHVLTFRITCINIFILKLVWNYNHADRAKMFKYGTFLLSSVSRVEVFVVVRLYFLYIQLFCALDFGIEWGVMHYENVAQGPTCAAVDHLLTASYKLPSCPLHIKGVNITGAWDLVQAERALFKQLLASPSASWRIPALSKFPANKTNATTQCTAQAGRVCEVDGEIDIRLGSLCSI